MPQFTFGRTITQLAITQGAAGALDLVAAPAAGGRIFVVQLALSAAGAGSVKFTEGTGPTDLTGAIVLATGVPLVLGDGNGVVLETKTAAAKLSLTSATAAVTGYLRFYIDTNP